MAEAKDSLPEHVNGEVIPDDGQSTVELIEPEVIAAEAHVQDIKKAATIDENNLKHISCEVEGADLIALSRQMRAMEVEKPRSKSPPPIKMHLIREDDACGSEACGFKPDETYKCRFCGLSFVHMNTLRCHERVHNIDNPFVCPKCGEAFAYNAEYEYHLSGHKEQKTYKCKCARSFYRYTDLLYHKCEIDDGLDDQVVDELRSDRERTASSYMKHPLQLYSDVRRQPYMCQFCNKSYGESRDLKNHMLQHRSERAYKAHAGASNFRASRECMWNQFRI